MSLKYSIVARKNPRDNTAPEKYYPQAQSAGVSDFKSLARRIQKNTGQSYADVTGVLAALEDVLSMSKSIQPCPQSPHVILAVRCSASIEWA